MDERQGFDALVTLLSQGLAQRSIYFASHPRVQQHARTFADRLAALLRAERREFFFLGFVEGNLVHEGRVLIGPTILGRRVSDLLQALDSGGILFKAGLTAVELLALFDVAAGLRARPAELSAARAALQQRQVVHLQLSPPYSDPGWFGQFLYEGTEPLIADGADGVVDDGLARMIPIYQQMFDAVEQAHELAGRNAALDIDAVRGVGEQLIVSADGSFTDIMQLVRYPDYDTFTVGHSVRVASIALLVGQSVGLARELQIELATAGMLHDVGKSRIPDTILYKTGRLDADERRLIERHPVVGAQILIENRQASQMAIAGAFGHHLRYDGGGYPVRPDWGVSSRITALLKVCDVFEALTAVRPYKAAMSAQSAYQIMLQDRGSFDPGALRALVAAMGLYPPGTHVVLTSGEHAVVATVGAKIDRPVVRITHDGGGAPKEAERLCDLAAAPADLRIARVNDRPVKARPAAATCAAAAAPCAHPRSDPAHDAILRQIQERR